MSWYQWDESEINNSTVVALFEEKLPRDIKREWIGLVTGEKRREICNKKNYFLLQLLLKFKARIEYEFSAMRNLERNSASSNYVENSVLTVGGVGVTGSRRPWCRIHPEENTHTIWRCLEFSGKPPKGRIDLVRNNNACYRCLEQGHSSRFCRKRFTCRTDNCGQQHHYLLHEAIRFGQSNHGQQKYRGRRGCVITTSEKP